VQSLKLEADDCLSIISSSYNAYFMLNCNQGLAEHLLFLHGKCIDIKILAYTCLLFCLNTIYNKEHRIHNTMDSLMFAENYM